MVAAGVWGSRSLWLPGQEAENTRFHLLSPWYSVCGLVLPTFRVDVPCWVKPPLNCPLPGLGMWFICMHNALLWVPRHIHKEVHPRTQQVEAEAQGCPRQHSEFEAKLGCTKACFKPPKQQTQLPLQTIRFITFEFCLIQVLRTEAE